jgi:enamine deaminase RidA (YjgF/YER057c/UK114 family)
MGCLRFDTSAGENNLPAKGVVCGGTGQPLLDGHKEDALSLHQASYHQLDCLEYLENEAFMIGMAQLPADPTNLGEQSHRIYRSIIETTGTRSLYRIWNFVPGINHETPGLLENYKLFCRGRAQAFAERFGDKDTTHFPSASATGCVNGRLTVIFLAGTAPATHWENPDQVPAYKYPQKYGPRSPAFARASRFTDLEGGEWILVAGTAAIKGSETLYPGDFERQLPVTLDNLDIVLRGAGIQLNGQSGARRRHLKVFLRHRSNLPLLKAAMKDILGPADTCSVVEAGICRADLEVEIEMTVHPAG